MSVMGIDPSLTSTGVVTLRKCGDMESFALSPLKHHKGMERLDYLIDAVLRTIGIEYPDTPSLIAIEGLAFGAQGRSALDLAGYGTALRHALWKHDYAYIDVPPTMVKKFATGKGNAKKDAMMLAVYKRWGYEFETTDETDAYVLARIALALTGQDRDDNLTEFQREVVKSLQSKEPELFKEMVK